MLEDSQLITRATDPFRKGRSLYRITEPLIVFYEAVMRREWTRLERGDTAGAWRNSQASFLAQVAGPHQIQIDVAVFAPDDPGRPRLHRARDLLAVKGYDMSGTRLTCYSGAGFDPELGNAARNDADVRLVGLDALYG